MRVDNANIKSIGDVMAGVGPFSIPAAKKGALVYSNDLNPESFKWLCENVRLNKVKEKFLLVNISL